MENGVFTVADFAKFARTTRDTLLHYDKIGLLSPVSRKGNGYRYYAHGQLGIMNVIRVLQAFGITLSEIREIMNARTPETTNEMLTRQIRKIEDELKKWKRARKLLLAMRQTIDSVADIDESAITVQFMPRKAIMLGGLNDYSGGGDDYDALLSFYRDMNRKYPDLDLNYPVWGFFSRERIMRGDWRWPDRYYFDNPDGFDRKPASLYAVGHMRGGYGHGGDLYKRMLAYIDGNGFEVHGDAYEEYPLNEISVANEEEYLIRIMIGVREKKRSSV